MTPSKPTASPHDSLDGPARVHVLMREPISRPGGLHSYVRGLVQGQRAIGLNSLAVDNITASGRFGVGLGERSVLDHIDPSGGVAAYHFAQGAAPFLVGRRSPWSAMPRVFHFHGPWFDEGRVQGDSAGRVRAKRLVERLVYHRFGNFVTASDAFRRRLVADFNIRPERVSTVHPGVDVERFRPRVSREAARSELGIACSGPLIVAVRRLEPRMGLEDAIRSLRHVPDAHLAIAGSGSHRAALEAVASESGVAPRVAFLGRVTDEQLPLVYRAGDVSVVPTIALEGFGMIVLESMAAGTPVVATDVGGLREAMGPLADEWMVQPASPDELGDALGRAIADGGLSDRARAYASTRTFSAMALELESALARFASDSSSPNPSAVRDR